MSFKPAPFACIALLAISILVPSPARADGFINNYRQWQILGPDGQAAYAMALFDSMLIFVSDQPELTARAVGLRHCGEALQLKAAMLATAITRYYQDYPEFQRAAPFVAFNAYLERGACSPFINKVRNEMGLKPMRELDPAKPE